MRRGTKDGWDPGDRRWLAAILVVAAVLRLTMLNPYGVYFYDELFQYVEQAWRVTSGQGIVTWDIRDAIRPPLLPIVLSWPMQLGVAATGTAFGGIVALRVAVALASLAVVASAWTIGRRWSPLHGFCAAVVMAIWYEAILFGDHVLSESLALDAFVAGAALASNDARRGRLAGAGLCFGLAAVFRMQYAPAVALYVILALPWQRWTWVIAGGMIALIAEAIADLSVGMMPFAWVLNNYQGNIVGGKISAAATNDPLYYLSNVSYAWAGFLLIPIALLALRAGRRAVPLAAVAGVVVAIHLIIPHQEYRYIALTVVLIIMIAGIGTGTVAQALVVRGWRTGAAAALLLAAWAAASGWAAWHNDLVLAIEREEEPMLRTLRQLGDDPGVCAVAVPVTGLGWLSRAYIGRAMPIYVLSGDRLRNPAIRAAESAGFNAAILPRGQVLPGFREQRCSTDSGGLCVQRRPGGCAPSADLRQQEVQIFLERNGL